MLKHMSGLSLFLLAVVCSTHAETKVMDGQPGEGTAILTQIALTKEHVCAARPGQMTCWKTESGELVDGPNFGDIPIIKLVSGKENFCALLPKGEISCWRPNSLWELTHNHQCCDVQYTDIAMTDKQIYLLDERGNIEWVDMKSEKIVYRKKGKKGHPFVGVGVLQQVNIAVALRNDGVVNYWAERIPWLRRTASRKNITSLGHGYDATMGLATQAIDGNGKAVSPFVVDGQKVTSLIDLGLATEEKIIDLAYKGFTAIGVTSDGKLKGRIIKLDVLRKGKNVLQPQMFSVDPPQEHSFVKVALGGRAGYENARELLGAVYDGTTGLSSADINKDQINLRFCGVLDNGNVMCFKTQYAERLPVPRQIAYDQWQPSNSSEEEDWTSG